MKRPFLIASALLALACLLHADTSDLLVQGPFGISGTIQTYKWEVHYPTGSITNSIGLMAAVFGTPTNTGLTYSDDFGGTYPIFSAGNNVRGATFIDFGGGSLFTIAFTFDGVKIEQTPDYATGWNSYVAAGGGTAGSYPAGAWTFASDGLKTRKVADGSFDGWVYGSTFPEVTIAGATAENAPLAVKFTTATVINLIPEPSSLLLVALGASILLRRR